MLCQDTDEYCVWSTEFMKANECARTFLGPITKPVILPAVLQGRLFKKLVPNLSAASETRLFTNELQMQIRSFELSLPILHEIQLCGEDFRDLCQKSSGWEQSVCSPFLPLLHFWVMHQDQCTEGDKGDKILPWEKSGLTRHEWICSCQEDCKEGRRKEKEYKKSSSGSLELSPGSSESPESWEPLCSPARQGSARPGWAHSPLLGCALSKERIPFSDKQAVGRVPAAFFWTGKCCSLEKGWTQALEKFNPSRVGWFCTMSQGQLLCPVYQNSPVTNPV